MKTKRTYALYYGDKFIGMGTREYLAKLINVKLETITFYASKYWLKKSDYQSWIVIKVEED